VEVDPFPKSQKSEVGELVERSLKLTMNGGQPEVGDPVKLAKGTCAEMVMNNEKEIREAASIFLPAIRKDPFNGKVLKQV
jgi:hypothetical protein